MFFGLLIPNIPKFIMSTVMLKSGIFTRLNAWSGIASNLLMIVYVVMITFIPAAGTKATAFAVPGGLLLIACIIMFTIKLFKLREAEEKCTDLLM
jgi:hypothetical protein